MRRCVARHSLDSSRHVDDPASRLLRLVLGLELRTRLQRLVYRHLQRERYRFGDRICLRIADIQHPPYIAHGLLRFHRSKGYDLRHLVFAVFLDNVIYDLAPSLVAEVYIYIRHADSFRIEEPLEDQVVLDRVYIRYPERVCHDAARCRASAGSDHYALVLRVVYEIPDYQEVFHVSHVFYRGKLIVEPCMQFCHLLAVCIFVPLLQPFFAEFSEILPVRHAVRGAEIRQVQLAEPECHVAAFCDRRRIVTGFRYVCKYPAHLIFGLEIELIVRESHPVFFIYRRRHLYAHQHVLCHSVLLSDIVHVVRGYKRYACLLVQPFHIGQYAHFLFESLILQLKEEIVLPEYLTHLESFFLCAGIIPVEQPVLHLSGKARGQRDQTFAVLPQYILVYPRLVVKAVAVTLRHDFHQVLVACIVFCQQHEMPHMLVLFGVLVEKRSGSSVYFTPYYRFYPLFQAFSVKVYHAEHHTVIGYRKRCHSKLFRM